MKTSHILLINNNINALNELDKHKLKVFYHLSLFYTNILIF